MPISRGEACPNDLLQLSEGPMNGVMYWLGDGDGFGYTLSHGLGVCLLMSCMLAMIMSY